MKAFPVPSYVNVAGETHDVSNQGMDLRDYFAAKAMQAMVSNCEGNNFDDFVIAREAYQMADFMINERNKNASEKTQ